MFWRPESQSDDRRHKTSDSGNNESCEPVLPLIPYSSSHYRPDNATDAISGEDPSIVASNVFCPEEVRCHSGKEREIPTKVEPNDGSAQIQEILASTHPVEYEHYDALKGAHKSESRLAAGLI